MATLTGVSISSSYTSLLKLDGNTDSTAAGNGSNAIQVKTGDDDATPLFLNTDRLGIGTANVQSPLHIYSTINNTFSDTSPFISSDIYNMIMNETNNKVGLNHRQYGGGNGDNEIDGDDSSDSNTSSSCYLEILIANEKM